MSRTRVIIADRQPVVLQGLQSILGASGFKVVACCRDGTSCMEAIRSLLPDIALVDISMPGLAGLKIFASIIAEKLPTRLVFFVASVEGHEQLGPGAVGPYGFILRDVAPEILVQSLRQVADGRKLLPPHGPDQAASRNRRNFAITDNLLTDRERQIIPLVSGGLSNKEIGRRLNIADGTIKVHLHNIYQKLEISNRTVLAALAILQNETSGSPDESA